MKPNRPRLVNRLAASGQAGWYRIENHAPDDVARLLIYDEIGWFGVSAEDLVRELDTLTASTIDLRLNTPGGSVFDGVAIFNALKNHPARVVATIDGLAASAGSFIAQAGDEIVMAEASTMMIHNALTFSVGTADDLRKDADLLDKMSDTIAGIYADRSGRSRDDFLALMKAETWFNADEAVAAGLADRVAGKAGDDAGNEPPDATARWDLSVFAYAGREQAPDPVIPAPVPAAPVAAAPPTPAPWSFDPEAFRNAIKEGVR